jgi:hypothetical protein
VRLAIGIKAHSGWAALVALGQAHPGRRRRQRDLVVADRHRMELADLSAGEWARQPYHAAEGLAPDRARDVVQRGIETARRLALAELQAAVVRAERAGHVVKTCAVLVGAPMPDWSTDEILAVHFRMHQAEGALYRDALIAASRACRLTPIELPEKRLADEASRAFRVPAARLLSEVSSLGSQVGPPWGKDQKDAALAAMMALRLGR